MRGLCPHTPKALREPSIAWFSQRTPRSRLSRRANRVSRTATVRLVVATQMSALFPRVNVSDDGSDRLCALLSCKRRSLRWDELVTARRAVAAVHLTITEFPPHAPSVRCHVPGSKLRGANPVPSARNQLPWVTLLGVRAYIDGFTSTVRRAAPSVTRTQ